MLNPTPRGAAATLILTTAVGLASFTWPLFVPVGDASYASLAPMLLGVVLVTVLAVAVAELTSDALDVKALAMIGVLAALGSIVRPLGAGTAGIEPVFFLLIIGGRVFGPGFGFTQGAITLASSALLTGGVGTWLPYEMIAAGLVGLGAGCLPRAQGRGELAVLATYAAVSSFAYGWLMDLAFWPFLVGGDTQLSYEPHAGALANLARFAWYNLATSMGWNLGRAVTTVALLLALGPGLLRLVRRAARRAAFRTPPQPGIAATGSSSALR